MNEYSSTTSSTITIPPEFSDNVMTIEAIKRGNLSIRGTGMTSWLWSKRLVMIKNTCITIHKLQNEGRALETLFFEEIRDLERCDSRTYCIKVATELKTLFLSFKSDEEMWSWMDVIYKRSPMKGVSSPTDFNHTAHISFDVSTGMITTLDQDPTLSAIKLNKSTLLKNPEILQDLFEIYQAKTPHLDHPTSKPKHRSDVISTTRGMLKSEYRLSTPLNPYDLPEIPKLSLFDDFELFKPRAVY